MTKKRKSRSHYFRSRRALRRMSQTDLANAIGYSAVMISHYETGRSLPPLGVAKQICKVLRTDLRELFPELVDDDSRPRREGAN